MTPETTLISRRTLLGAALAGAVSPRLAYGQETTGMRIRVEFNAQSMIAALEDNPSARDLASMLPLDLVIDDYSTNEKIAYLPRRLSEDGSGPFGGEAPGDLCYFAPWGNLAFFHAGYRYSNGLIRLGRIEGSFEPLRVPGQFDLRIELLP